VLNSSHVFLLLRTFVVATFDTSCVSIMIQNGDFNLIDVRDIYSPFSIS